MKKAYVRSALSCLRADFIWQEADDEHSTLNTSQCTGAHKWTHVTAILIKSARVLRNNWSECHLLHDLQAGRWHDLFRSMAGSSEALSVKCFCGINPGLCSYSFPGPVKQLNAVLQVIFTRFYHCVHSLAANRLFQASHEIKSGCTESAERQSWLCLCALEPCVLERTTDSMFPKLKHKPLLACTCMTTWVSRGPPPTRTGEWSHLQLLFQVPVLGSLLWNYWHLNFCQQLKVVSSSLVGGNTQ